MRRKFSFFYVDIYSYVPKSFIFVADTKTTFGYNFEAALCIRSFEYYF